MVNRLSCQISACRSARHWTGDSPARPNAGKATGFLGDADDELLYVFRGIAEHLCAAGIGVDLGTAKDRLNGAGRIATAAFEAPDHRGQTLTAETGLGIEDALQGFQLFTLDLGDEFARRELVGLNGKVCLPIPGLDDVACGQPAVICRNPLGKGNTGQQAQQQDTWQLRCQRHPRARQAA